jgi:hypothetical protein
LSLVVVVVVVVVAVAVVFGIVCFGLAFARICGLGDSTATATDGATDPGRTIRR